MAYGILKKRLSKLVRRPRNLAKRVAEPLRKAMRPPDYGTLQKRIHRLEQDLHNLRWQEYAHLSSSTDQRTLLRRSEFSVHSQNGEDGLLLFLFAKLGTTDRRFIEFGIGDPGKSNSTFLARSFGWAGLLIDLHPDFVEAARALYADSPQVKVVRERVTPKNIDEIFLAAGFQGQIDLLSVDIDGNDYWVWEAISAVEPRVVVAEYNASLGIDDARVTIYDEGFNRFDKHPLGWYHGASLPAMTQLGQRKGYRLVGCDSSGFNALFVRNDVAEGRLEELSPAEAYYPDARRLRIASLEDQLASLAELAYARP